MRTFARALITALTLIILLHPAKAADELPFGFDTFAERMQRIGSAVNGTPSLVGFKYSGEKTELTVYFTSGNQWLASACSKISNERWLCQGGYPLQNGVTIIKHEEKGVDTVKLPVPKAAGPNVNCILPDSSKEEMSAAACQSLRGKPG